MIMHLLFSMIGICIINVCNCKHLSIPKKQFFGLSTTLQNRTLITEDGDFWSFKHVLIDDHHNRSDHNRDKPPFCLVNGHVSVFLQCDIASSVEYLLVNDSRILCEFDLKHCKQSTSAHMSSGGPCDCTINTTVPNAYTVMVNQTALDIHSEKYVYFALNCESDKRITWENHETQRDIGKLPKIYRNKTEEATNAKATNINTCRKVDQKGIPFGKDSIFYWENMEAPMTGSDASSTSRDACWSRALISVAVAVLKAFVV